MNRPDSIPLHLLQEYAVVPPKALGTLFGSSYRFRGTERLEIYQAGRVRGIVAIQQGETPALFLDPRTFRSLHTELPVRLKGPAGAISIANIGLLPRHLRLPPAIQKAWDIPSESYVTIQVGEVHFTHVPVLSGNTLRFELCETDALAARYWEHGTGQLLRISEDRPSSSASFSPPPKRLITETDIRRARMEHRTIRLQPGQLITPSARMLGRELGVLEE